MTTTCLAMVVRDAEHTVARCIASCLPFVDRAVIIDTGSVDDTMTVVKQALCGLPAAFHQSEWVSHAHNRSELLARARESGAEYTLMPDADTELVQYAPLRELTKDEYLIPIKDRGLVYPLPLLTSNHKPYRYEGVTHAYLACDQATEGELLDELYFIDHGGGPKPGKLERDRDVLAAEVARNPADRRSWFYLAQTYRDLEQPQQAIAAYRMRATLGGWPEEIYQSLYQAGALLSAHVNFYDGAQLLLAAAKLKPNRAEALRALANCADAVADKIPQPADEVLFVEPAAYTAPQPLHPDKVSAVLPTRGDKDLAPILDNLPYDDVVVYDNSQQEDVKVYARYKAVDQCKNDVIFSIDDDVIFTAHDRLLAAYEPGKIVANMGASWAAVYNHQTALVGAGALWDRNLPERAFDLYLAAHPLDDDFLLCCDFVFGSMTPFKLVDLGFEARPFADDDDRLYRQPGQTERKFKMIERAQAMAA